MTVYIKSWGFIAGLLAFQTSVFGFDLPFNEDGQVISCREFQSVLLFVENQHLRFDTINAAQKIKMREAALSKVPDALENMGYLFLAAQFDKITLKQIRKNQEAVKGVAPKALTHVELCNELKTNVFRTAYLKAYVRSLDPYSDFYAAEELDSKSSALDGAFIGVGIGTDLKDTGLVINEVVPGGPAEGHLEVGDLIQKIDGHTVLGLKEIEIRQRIRGKKGTSITFNGTRKSNTFEVTIIRDQVQQKSVAFNWLDKQVLNIRIFRFFRQTAAEVESIVKNMGPKAKGFILDLRNNPGGLLTGARDVVDLFVSQGVVVYLKGKGSEDQVWAMQEGGELTKPLVVLVNEGTASAAEIVAGALQDYGRAIVVGEKTYGKGSVQNIYETQGSLGTHYRGGIKLTTLWYYLPSGRSVHSLTPDIQIPSVETVSIEHPQMPFHGPEKIAIIREPVQFGKNRFNAAKAKSILEKSKDVEEVGKALLKEMLAGSSR